VYCHPVPTPAEVIETVFTTANPESGSLPPPDIAWAVFEGGTVFFAAPRDGLDGSASLDDVEAAARAALGELGPVRVATPSADFTVSRLSGWYPDDPVWFIGFDSVTLATIVIEDFDSDLAAGMTGRAIRDRDHEAMHVVSVRNFRGERR
jgi:hypothetical protein